jgi:hypothetical protein
LSHICNSLSWLNEKPVAKSPSFHFLNYRNRNSDNFILYLSFLYT